MLGTLEVSPWGCFYLLLHDLGPGLPSFLCNEHGAQLELLCLFIGGSGGLCCLYKAGLFQAFGCKIYLEACILELCLALLLSP